MGYFPFFIELADKSGLVVGGGAVALRKVKKLMPYGPSLTVVARTILPEFESLSGINILQEPFSPSMLDGMYFVIAATDDTALNQQIAQLCVEQGILVNVVDDQENCTFLFPALVKEGNLSVGISTGGASPSASVWLKEKISNVLPENMEGILDYLSLVRRHVKAVVAEEKRSRVYAAIFNTCMAKGCALTEEELARVLEEML